MLELEDGFHLNALPQPERSRRCPHRSPASGADVRDDDLVDAVLAFIEDQIDGASEETRINSVASLPDAQRALAVMSRVWGEVVNGGLPQFFYNRTDPRWHAWGVESARLMRMPRTEQALEAGREILRELLADPERSPLDWSEYCDLVREAFEARCRSTFWEEELEDFGRLAAAFIRGRTDLHGVATEALAKREEDERARADTERTVTDRERGLLLTADRLAAYLGDLRPHRECEKFTAAQSVDGTFHVKYEYADPAYGLSILCKAYIHPSEDDAANACESSAQLLRGALGWDPNAQQRVNDRNEFYRWGDQSYYSEIARDVKRAGFGFYARSGAKRFSLTIYGLIFEDTAAIKEALQTPLANLLAYEPA